MSVYGRLLLTLLRTRYVRTAVCTFSRYTPVTVPSANYHLYVDNRPDTSVQMRDCQSCQSNVSETVILSFLFDQSTIYNYSRRFRRFRRFQHFSKFHQALCLLSAACVPGTLYPVSRLPCCASLVREPGLPCVLLAPCTPGPTRPSTRLIPRLHYGTRTFRLLIETVNRTQVLLLTAACCVVNRKREVEPRQADVRGRQLQLAPPAAA